MPKWGPKSDLKNDLKMGVNKGHLGSYFCCVLDSRVCTRLALNSSDLRGVPKQHFLAKVARLPPAGPHDFSAYLIPTEMRRPISGLGAAILESPELGLIL